MVKNKDTGVDAQRQPQRGRGRLAALATEQGESIIDIVKNAIVETGSIYQAAQKLGVVPSTIQYHLRKAGLTIRVRMVVEFVPLDENEDANEA